MNHEVFMRQALALAERGRGWVSPNPMVGALVVRAGQIVGRGWHPRFGEPHAEVFALKEAGEAARGATLYCTLEPCNHTGKTPPCAPAVAAAGIRQVVLGTRDPNPVACGGCETLRRDGIEVIEDVCESECRALNTAFFKFVRTGLPLVTAKWAMTLDGKIASAPGDSKWITGEQARARVHQLRGLHDAVLIGVRTLIADGPLLNCRTPSAAQTKQPRRVILDSQARAPLDSPFWKAAPAGSAVIICKASAPAERVRGLQALGAEVLALETEAEVLPLEQSLRALAKAGVLSVLVEGGSSVLGSLLDGRLIDQVYAFIAPKLLGGRDSFPAIAGCGIQAVNEALLLQGTELESLGADVLVKGRLGAWNWAQK